MSAGFGLCTRQEASAELAQQLASTLHRQADKPLLLWGNGMLQLMHMSAGFSQLSSLNKNNEIRSLDMKVNTT